MLNKPILVHFFTATTTAALLAFAGCNVTGGGDRNAVATAQKNNAGINSNTSNKANTGSKGDNYVIDKEFTANLPADFRPPADEVGKRLLKEYGALFVSQGKVAIPQSVIFKDAAAVSGWQANISTARENIGGVGIELQSAAMFALKEAVEEATANSLSITPRGTDAARRSYEDTEKLWASRVEPGLKHWAAQGKISGDEAARIRALSPFEQVPEIFKLESEGMFFSKDLSKTIIYSVAPPGTSQHLSMLALDVTEHDNTRVREILARHGWFQTVVSDLPHFTFLGVSEKDLPSLGLQKIENGGRVFWVPK